MSNVVTSAGDDVASPASAPEWKSRVEQGLQGSRSFQYDVVGCLTEMDLRSQHLGGRECRELADALRAANTGGKVCTLEALDLYDNNVGPEACAYLCEVLVTLPRLKLLWVHSCQIGSVGLDALAALIATPGTGLQALRLNDNVFDEESVINFAKALGGNRSLRIINFGPSGMTPSSLDALAQAVMANSVLEQLSITEIESEQVAMIQRAFKDPNRGAPVVKSARKV